MKSRLTHSRHNSLKIIINDKADEVVEDILKSLLSTYQIGIEKTMKGSNFIFGCVDLSRYKCHKTNMNCNRL